MTAISRREALAGAAGLAVAACLPVAAASAASPSATALVAALDHPASARAIGAAVLAAEPLLARDSVAGELARAVGLAADRLPTIDRALLRARLDAARSADFRLGRTVSVEGWVLAATEARLCALAALT